MNAHDQQEIGRRLDEALRSAGLMVERVNVVRGNVKDWAVVPGASIVGRLMAVSGWRVRVLE